VCVCACVRVYVCASSMVCCYPGWVVTEQEFQNAQAALKADNVDIDTAVEIPVQAVTGTKTLLIVGNNTVHSKDVLQQ